MRTHEGTREKSRKVQSSGKSSSLLGLSPLYQMSQVRFRHLKSQCDSGVRRDKWQINLGAYRAYINRDFSLTLPLVSPIVRHENVHHHRNSQGDYLATDLIGSLQPTSGRGMHTGSYLLKSPTSVTRREK